MEAVKIRRMTVSDRPIKLSDTENRAAWRAGVEKLNKRFKKKPNSRTGKCKP